MEERTQQGGGNSGHQGRQGNGGQNRSRNRNNNRNRNRNSGGNRNRNRNYNKKNRNGGGGGGYKRGGRPAPTPKRTAGQWVLAILTFGVLGKPTRKKRPSNRPSQKSGKPTSQKKPQKKAAARPRKKPVLEEVTSGRLYVGNLDYGASEADLEELFKGVGTVVSAEVVINSRTQQSKGFAFVEMGNIDEARRAVEILHDQDFLGRKLLVSGARSGGPRDENDDDSSSKPSEAADGNSQSTDDSSETTSAA